MRTSRVVLAGCGLVCVAVGAVYLSTSLTRWSDLVGLVLWGLVPVLLSDLVLLPLVVLLGWFVARVVPGRWRVPVVVGLVLSAAVLAVAWPFLGGWGHRPDNPSLLDLDYPFGVAVVLAVIWVGVGVWTPVAICRGRLRAAREPDSGD